jgi:hypothetical protein
VSREVNAAILEAINASGEAFLIHTELGGEFTMRLAIGATNQQVCGQHAFRRSQHSGRFCSLCQRAVLSQSCNNVPNVQR